MPPPTEVARFYRAGGRSAVCSMPRAALVNLGPRLDEPALPPWQLTTDELDRVDRNDADVILVVRMEVWSVVRSRRIARSRASMVGRSRTLRRREIRTLRLQAIRLFGGLCPDQGWRDTMLLPS